MDCPVCKNVQLLMTDRQGIEIDYCPNCRGVWLDRGELDKIIDRSAENASPAQQQVNETPYSVQQSHTGHGQYQQPYGHHGHSHYKNKRKSFLGELFDFD